MKKENRELSNAEKLLRTKAMIIAFFVLSLLLIVVCASVPGLLSEEGTGKEREALPPVDPSKLYDTKEEDFDILEYDEYLKYDRNIYFYDKMTGVRESIDGNSSSGHGAGYKLLYDLLNAVIAGDLEAYNDMVCDELQYENVFTQQQLYDIVVTKQSQSEKGGYTEYVFLVEYKIHENNGTFRNTVESDASRPQYFVINNSTGELLVMDIIDITYN